MKNKLKKLIISASSISALIGLSAGSYFLYTFLNQNKEQIVDNNSVNVKIPLNNNDLSDYIDIVEMPTKFLKDSNINSFMFTKLNSKGEKDTSALEALGKEFIKRVFYGPEILQLKKIIIGGNDFFNNSDKTLGFYTSATNSIYINSRFFAEKIFFQNKIKINNDFSFQNNWTEVANDEEKIEIIMPTLFHEYGHHIASVYANNNNFGDIYDLGKNDNNIYFNDINNNQGTTSQNWNKEFVKDFKNVFFNEENLLSPKGINRNNIGIYFSAKEIFDFSNKNWNIKPKQYELNGSTDRDKIYNIYNQIYKSSVSNRIKISNTNYQVNPNFLQINGALPTDLQYYYSLEEQFTRKLMSFTYNPLLNLVNKPNNVLNKINNLVKWNSYIYDLIHSAAIKSKDFLNSEKNSNKIFQPFLNDFIYGKTNDYTDNNINLNVQKSLDSYLNLMGYGNAISTLSFDNKSTILVNSKGELVIKENINYNSLNFGGYIDSNKYKNIKGIVYTNKKNEQIMVPIIINEGNLYGWNSPILGKRNKEINKIHSSLGQFSFYNLSKNINANDISLNYSFEFWNDTNNDNEFSTNEILSMSNFKNNKFIKNNTITSYRGDAKKSNSSYYLIDENFKLIKRKVN